ncbi:hypothetical protein PM082_020021 [Marasmius tenuissimus]|nr:hypothetical protein PM082_020021 [Marasmius tenuissimus]
MQVNNSLPSPLWTMPTSKKNSPSTPKAPTRCSMQNQPPDIEPPIGPNTVVTEEQPPPCKGAASQLSSNPRPTHPQSIEQDPPIQNHCKLFAAALLATLGTYTNKDPHQSLTTADL